MDEKIARKRAKQDEMIKAIMNSRSRRDSRIKQRRDREDIAFQRFYEDLEEEEGVSCRFAPFPFLSNQWKRLRQRLKRLKRGLPMEDNAATSRRPSFNSPTSPVTTSYSTIPPPAKRRRTSQPPYQEQPPHRPPEMVHHQLPPVDRHAYPYHPHHGPPLPSTPYSNQGHHVPYPPLPLQSPKNNHSRPPPEMGPYPPNGYHHSPHAPPSAPIQPTTTPTQVPPRPSMSTYDTRPPPPAPVSSGFAAVNQPPHSGFAAVNSHHVETPPALNSQLMRESSHKQSSTPVDETPVRPSLGEEKGSSGSGSGANKRTPSTTHPYQMSEAFANRHHHCERTDSINRGIWTWYGPGGTQDRPTAQPTEMYLKCNHESCGRIDWRTVHGLQCHIVKNHEQPKGTIGSLEKALAAYGVPVREIEEIEKRDGLGSGGTMADPKNVKVRAKIRESGDRRDLSGRETPVSAGVPPLMKQQTSSNSDSPTAFSNQRIEPEKRPLTMVDQRVDGSATSPIDLDKPAQNRPVTGFAAVNSGWANINHRPNPTPPLLNRDTSTPDRQGTSGGAHSPPAAPSFWSGWQPKPLYSSPKPPQPLAEPHTQATQQSQTPQTPQIQQIQQTQGTQQAHPATEDRSKSMTMPFPEREHDEMEFAKTDTIAPAPTANIEKRDFVITSQLVAATEVKDAVMEDVPAVVRISDVPVSEEAGQPVKANVWPSSTDTMSVTGTKIAEEKIEAQTETTSTLAPTEETRTITARADEPPATTPVKETIIGLKEEAKTSPQSPGVTTKRVISRRESRRASVATASSSKFGTEKGKEDDHETGPSRAATENTVDEDGDDTIEVNSTLSKADQKERERLKEEERNQTPPRRLANGRFTRRSLR